MSYDNIQENFSLLSLNTFAIDAKAKYFARVDSQAKLAALLASEAARKQRLVILGGGSNVLFSQALIDGLVVKLDLPGIEVVDETDEHAWVKVGAGEQWHDLVRFCIHHGYGGIENLSLIPGSVGAAPMQNIGAYGVEIKHVFEQLDALHIESGKLRIFNKLDCEFGYRDSVFKRDYRGQYVICNVTLKLRKQPHFQIDYRGLREALAEMGVNDNAIALQTVSDAVIKIRRSKLPDPNKLGNAGSFFKNPQVDYAVFADLQSQYPDMPYFAIDGEHGKVKIPAAWLIEQCGWKGKRQGNVGVHAQQALVLVNYGGGSGQEILQLANEIRDSVTQRFGIELEPEVNVVG